MTVQIFSTLRSMDMKSWIFNARTRARLTQAQLGERLGMTKGNVSAWENGRHEASLDQLVRIAEVTGYAEPLPGMPSSNVLHPVSAGRVHYWPFEGVDEDKVLDLSDSDRVRLETAILIAAAQVGLDVKRD